MTTMMTMMYQAPQELIPQRRIEWHNCKIQLALNDHDEGGVGATAILAMQPQCGGFRLIPSILVLFETIEKN